MNIGVIDSGINKDWIAYDAEIIEEKNFAQFYKEKEGHQIHIHGTLVINTIQKYSRKKNRYYVCNIMNDIQKGSSRAVLDALQYLQKIEGLQIVIMSLCIQSLCNKREIDIALKQLNHKGIIIFAAASNIEKGGYPATSPYVMGVGKAKKIFDEKILFHQYAKIQVFANAYPEFVSLGKGNYHIFMGSSKAVSMVAGIVIRLLNQKQWNKRNVMYCLRKQRLKKNIRYFKNRKNGDKEWGKYSADNQWIWEDIEEFVSKKYKIKMNHCRNNFNMRITEIVGDINDIYELLQFISNKRKRIIDYHNITFNEFKTVGALLNYFTLCFPKEEI